MIDVYRVTFALILFFAILILLGGRRRRKKHWKKAFKSRTIIWVPNLEGTFTYFISEGNFMIKMTDSQYVVAGPVVWIDKKGNPAPIDVNVPLVWETSDPAILLIEPSSDLLTCKISAVGPLTPVDTSIQVSCTADADLGDGFEPVVAIEQFQIIGGKAVAGTMATSAPAEQV